jgi:death on curing protein
VTHWVEEATVLAIHEEQLSEHGGPSGIRDEGLLDSALARPANLTAYGNPDIFDLAAAYAFGITQNHPFIDGNKRTSLVVTELFLEMNGHSLDADDIDCLTQWLALSSGNLPESDLAEWLRTNSRPHEMAR